MTLRRVALLSWCIACVTLVAPRVVGATSLKITEIVTGLQADPNVQYVLLRFDGAGGSTNGYVLYQYDDANPPAGLGSTFINADMGNTQDGAPILLANRAAEAFFHVNADVVFTGKLATNGVLCLMSPSNNVPDDCVIWGTASYPNQYPAPIYVFPFNPSGGIPVGMVARRNANNSDANNNWSARDFWAESRPFLVNNRGGVGTVPTSTCGNGVVEGLEECDDGAAHNGATASCSSTCVFNRGAACPVDLCPSGHSVCPNGAVEPGEQCDDRNTVNSDGCSNTCRWEPIYSGTRSPPVCGNHILEPGETCDPPGSNCNDSSNPAIRACTIKSSSVTFCGDGAVEAPDNPNFNNPSDPNAQEQCDPNDQTAPQPCTTTCRWPDNRPLATCGNGFVETSEECDDGNTTSGDGCSATCQIEALLANPPWACGNGTMDPYEACDNGANNGHTGNACKADCSLVNPPAYNAGSTGGTSTGLTTSGSATAGATSGGTTAGSSTAGTTSAGSSSTGSGSSTNSGSSATTGSSRVVKGLSCSASSPEGTGWMLLLVCAIGLLSRPLPARLHVRRRLRFTPPHGR